MANELRFAVITVSDGVHAGVRQDRSGPRAAELARAFFLDAGWMATTGAVAVVPDDARGIVAALREALAGGAELVLTTGGTGLGPRDVTPEATREVIEREVAGLVEAVRARWRAEVPAVDLSRAIAGVARTSTGQALVINLPGSVRAVEQFLAVLLPLLPHAVEMLRGGDRHP